ncbi:MAG: glycoside hydrolase family 15 protein [Anaerolineaceae bacterium]|nr:glycoside hydrolase family 15 protein [Anaerolineaceae bacterium]
MDLYHRSIDIIKENQAASGAYVASPSFPTYHYCWLRDGSYIAYAMDTAGEHDSAERFFRWVGRAVVKYASKLDVIRDHLYKGLPLGKDDFLHTRFSLDGLEDTRDAEWGNFQIDGYGTWLWALAEHVSMTKNWQLFAELRPAVDVTLHYLELVWQLPNYDCWEEHPDYLHPYTLSTVYGGVDSIDRLIRMAKLDSFPTDVKKLKNEVKDFILKYAVDGGMFVKHVYPAEAAEEPYPLVESGVDASLLGLALPYQVVPLNDLTLSHTLARIESDLRRPGGGLYRYKEDVYYGGGEWILLTAWLGWVEARSGKSAQAHALQTWIEAQADANGDLAEQICDHPLFPQEYQPWIEKWGPIAKPLLWSHAMYVILVNELSK